MSGYIEALTMFVWAFRDILIVLGIMELLLVILIHQLNKDTKKSYRLRT